MITAELEFLEARFATAGDGAKPDDLDLYLRASNNLRRLLEAVGLQRRARDVTPLIRSPTRVRTSSARHSNEMRHEHPARAR